MNDESQWERGKALRVCEYSAVTCHMSPLAPGARMKFIRIWVERIGINEIEGMRGKAVVKSGR